MMTFYAMHDALVKPMPGNAMTPRLAESWSAARDGRAFAGRWGTQSAPIFL
jgi:hypothetical protein